MMTNRAAKDIEKGIACYKKERDILVRLIRKSGTLTETKFDMLFRNRQYRRPCKLGRGISGDSFILGMGINGGTDWAFNLELLQMLVELNIVKTHTDKMGRVVYSLVDNGQSKES